MIKRCICSLLIVILCVPLSGCWNYRGLNKMSIVSGVAIDRNVDNSNYHLTIETLDLSGGGGKENSEKSQIIEAEGKTIFDAVRNTKKRLSKKLYFGSIQLIVISNQIAKEEGIQPVLDWFMRDRTPRESVTTVISQEKTAKEILTSSGLDNKIISEEIEKIIDADSKTTTSTKNIETYQVIDILKGNKKAAVVLPAVHCADNKEKKVAEINGIAIFRGDKLQGYLSPEETHYYLFTVDDIDGGILTFAFNEDNQENQVNKDNISLEITKNKTKKSYTYDGNHLKVLLETKTTVYLGEVGADIDVLKKENIEKIKEAATPVFVQRMETVVNKVQTEFGLDIFEIGTMIHQKNPALWAELKENWDYYMRTMEVEIKPEFVIVNTGLTK